MLSSLCWPASPRPPKSPPVGQRKSISVQCAFQFSESIAVAMRFMFSFIFFAFFLGLVCDFAIIRVLFNERWGEKRCARRACNINFIKSKSKSFRVSSLEQYIVVWRGLPRHASHRKVRKLCTQRQTAKCRLRRSIYVEQTSFLHRNVSDSRFSERLFATLFIFSV